jgi:CheY-like chemotaxis protein
MDGYGKRILIVDDDESSRHMLSLLLANKGYNIHIANDGLEALSEMKKRRFDAVITDYHLSRLNGLELLALCRVVWPETPIIMVSSDPSALGPQAVERGAVAWVRKPYDSRALLDLLTSAVGAAGSGRGWKSRTRVAG